ncbi:hypothetical protein AX14_007860 [Amanita brunnescens Koide BX004]|nr:hypothetical protein AX14_013542 [Amanita brunnescens Koide BX004]KAF8726146.1 hypothetical protein AX14_008034 [Amanita brunnescens Koide BX004]KAF8726448.1 hypothetical protein AX14_007860 [Amanita brunnescens Koide BX004]
MSSAVAAAVTKPIAPPSAFAELLRRSRFASYDPAIRQTYSSPAAHAHRGDWGLKRPISVRRRNAFISLASFEHHANFTEWNNAENEVRFIRRIEEMCTTPLASPRSTWSRNLGNNKNQVLMDSDFCPGEDNVFGLAERKHTPVSANLVNFGDRGPGQYGPNRPHERPLRKHVIPNFSGMSQRLFDRYLRKLRALRPEFKEYVTSREDTINKSLYELSQNKTSNHHTHFISNHTAQEYRNHSSRKIEEQPHTNAALMYACPTPLGSSLVAEAQPGIVLQSHDKKSNFSAVYNTSQAGFLASFGGLSTFVDKRKRGGKDPVFDFNSEEGIAESELKESVKKSVGDMRISRLCLLQAPRVVGRHAQGLRQVRLDSRVVVQSSHFQFKHQNLYQPGTPEYVAAGRPDNSYVAANWPTQESQFDRVQLVDDKQKEKQDGKAVLSRLSSMTGQQTSEQDDELD